MEQSEARYFEMNRIGWDCRAAVHVESRFYDVDGFLAGASSLREIELAEQASPSATFACSDVYVFSAPADTPFDIVYTSYGALCWRVIRTSLSPYLT